MSTRTVSANGSGSSSAPRDLADSRRARAVTPGNGVRWAMSGPTLEGELAPGRAGNARRFVGIGDCTASGSSGRIEGVPGQDHRLIEGSKHPAGGKWRALGRAGTPGGPG